MSYDVKALFTSVPVDLTINMKNKVGPDAELPNRTYMSSPNIIAWQGFSLKSTYFLFQGKYYEEVWGAAMELPINSIVASLFMQDFEVRVTNTSSSSSLQDVISPGGLSID